MSLETKPRGPESASQGSSEVLLLDKDQLIQDGLRKLLSASGQLLVTATDDAKKAIHLVAEKHFAVAVLDMDTPEPEAGLGVMAELKFISPATAVMLLVSRQTFDSAVRGFRGGAVDVVAKLPENVKSLTERVLSLCQEGKRAESRDHLLQETLEVHEQFLKKLLDTSRRALQAEEVTKGDSKNWEVKECTILVVDENDRTGPGLQEALGTDAPFKVVAAVSGGEALDYASSGFHIAMVNERISDLPWQTVVRSLRKQVAEGIVLLLTEPAQGPGSVSIIEENQTIELIPQLNRGSQLVEAMHTLREAYVAKSRERHHLQSFRKEHYDFLKRYAGLRQKLSALLPEEKK